MGNWIPQEWTPPKIKNTPSFCAVTERQVGYNIDAYYLPQNNSIYTCFEDTDTKEWRDYAMTHEDSHAYMYGAMTDRDRAVLKQIYEKMPKYDF